MLQFRARLTFDSSDVSYQHSAVGMTAENKGSLKKY